MTTTSTDPVADLRALMLASQRFRQAMADHFHINLSEAVVLGHLATQPAGLTPRELAELMLLGSGTLTAILDRLADAGYARRKPNPRDRRSSLITLTPAGRRVVRHINGRLERALSAATADQLGSKHRAANLAQLAAALHHEADHARRTTPQRPPQR